MTTKMYVTRYALTKGIQEEELELIVAKTWTCRPFGIGSSFKVGVEAFYTKEEAIKAAEKLRQEKITSMQKKIKRLENITFE